MKCKQRKSIFQQSRSEILAKPYNIYSRKMPYGSLDNAPRFFPPPPFLHPRQYNFQRASGSWACDHCQVATFDSYQEALHHEQLCPMNQNRLKTHSSGKLLPAQRDKLGIALSMPGDKDSLSDRQCYVRSYFVEAFSCTEDDVATRHSKGAQKLHVGQIGIRCRFCKHFSSKDRAERAMCYPSSVSRIYQTVADMQRFHFEACTAIPPEMKRIYKSLKTTRPRGVGSPQLYWIESAKELGFVDSSHGIKMHRVASESPCDEIHSQCHRISQEMPFDAPVSPTTIPHPSSLPPLSPESQSTSTSSMSNEQEQSETSDCEMTDRDEEAIMLLSLRNNVVQKN